MNDLWIVYKVLENEDLEKVFKGTWEELEQANYLGSEYGVCTLNAWKNYKSTEKRSS